jgi:hypothetical protein
VLECKKLLLWAPQPEKDDRRTTPFDAGLTGVDNRKGVLMNMRRGLAVEPWRGDCVRIDGADRAPCAKDPLCRLMFDVSTRKLLNGDGRQPTASFGSYR